MHKISVRERRRDGEKRHTESDGKKNRGKKKRPFLLAYWHPDWLIWTAHSEPSENTVFQYNYISSVLS